MPREMLRARHHEMLLTSLNPGRRVRADDARIGAECERLADWIPGLDVEVAHRGADPGEADRPCLGAGDLAAGVRRVEIVEVAERRGRRKLGQAFHLFAGPALAGGADA